jgi:predicted dienelactone hydrolase
MITASAPSVSRQVHSLCWCWRVAGPICRASCSTARPTRASSTAAWPETLARDSTAAQTATSYPLKALVVAAPALGFTFTGGLDDLRIPVQLWRADDDAVRAALPTAPEFHAVPGAWHFDFLTPCSAELQKIAPPICRSARGFDRAAFQETFNATVVEFFQRELAAQGH